MSFVFPCYWWVMGWQNLHIATPRLDIVAADEERDLAAATAVEVRRMIFGIARWFQPRINQALVSKAHSIRLFKSCVFGCCAKKLFIIL